MTDLQLEPQTLDQTKRRDTYWSIVARAYWRGLQARVATGWAILILLLTVFVPFIANEAPYTVIINGHREFPLFRDLTRVDLIWLVWGAAVVAFIIVCRRARRVTNSIEEIRSRRLRWIAILLGIATLASAAVVLLKTDFLDVRNYHEMSGAGQLQGAVFAPLRWGYADQEPLQANRIFELPTKDHWLGTDGNGRDAVARLLWGARVILEIGFVSELISLAIGVLYGALMGYFSGTIDILGMRFVEWVEAIPQLFLLITFIAIFGRQFFMIMVIIGITSWTGIARFVRAEFLRMRNMDYVSAAKAMGLPTRNILFRHMLPNGLTPVIVTFTFGVAGNIVSESILSFLGIGIEPPTSSWGVMLEEAGNPAETFHVWLALAPGLMIFLTVLAYNIMGEAMRDAIDPKTNKIQ